MDNCILCGEVLTEGKCPTEHKFKKMCLNCAYCVANEDGDLICNNEVNLNNFANKMKEAASGVTESYRITTMEIAPVALKKPLIKCKQWELSDAALEAVKALFV